MNSIAFWGFLGLILYYTRDRKFSRDEFLLLVFCYASGWELANWVIGMIHS